MERYRAFMEIVREGSFTRAADRLGYTQSALSQMVASLEKELGLNLLIRSRSGVVLSKDGATIYPNIEALLNCYQAIAEKAGEIRGIENSVIRIGSFTSISTYWLPQLFEKFKNRYPGAEFIIEAGNDNDDDIESVKSGAVDFSFSTVLPHDNLEVIPLKEGGHSAVLPKGHPLADLDVVPLEDLAKETFILNESSEASEVLLGMEEYGIKPNIHYTIENDASIMSMVEHGLGVSILSDLTLSRSAFDIEIRRISPELRRRISIVCRKRETLSLAANRFIDFVISEVPNLP